ncbi:DUF2325 domain-containing protein [Undibacterium sp. CY7W]|uniref:DUF2325 domain-containing protein n=1 Tax=Undibacterium rugosum TaxID=2762291 RepID=A0A923L0L6_9BURK|nr:DUF2325 domain-containing protein [Undibacterium rugosum]
MCDHGDERPFLSKHTKESHNLNKISATGSRRRRIWDLPHECHCPVVGVCIPLTNLRRLINKALNGQNLADDYEIHVGAVAECGRRNKVSELIQQELDQRYNRTIQQFRLAKTQDAVVRLWIDAIHIGDVAGAFWAALTHPRCDTTLQEGLCRDMHMLQHQAGASVRADLSRFNALIEENALLTRELGRVQERSTRLMTEKSNEIERLNTQLTQIRAELIGKDSSIAFLSADITALKTSIPDLDTRKRLLYKLDQMTERQTELETSLREAQVQLAEFTKSKDSEHKNTELLEPVIQVIPITLYLQQKNVLCVGGRSGNVSNYRDLIERVGGRFAHHDGGVEDNQNLLDANLAAADLVICQTGCISHNAYWRVKDFCKRTGKRCVFVENPSTTSLARGLEQFSDINDMNVEFHRLSLD